MVSEHGHTLTTCISVDVLLALVTCGDVLTVCFNVAIVEANKNQPRAKAFELIATIQGAWDATHPGTQRLTVPSLAEWLFKCLGAWLSQSFGMAQQDHAKHKPTRAQIQSYI